MSGRVARVEGENGYCESFNSKLRDEFLNGEIFYSLGELQVLAERWRVHYNTRRPLFAGLQTTGPGSVAEGQQRGAWNSRSRCALPTFPRPRLLRNSYPIRCATLTISLVQKIGQAKTILRKGDTLPTLLAILPPSSSLSSKRSAKNQCKHGENEY